MADFKPLGAYIVAACRTPAGKNGGRLSAYHPADLGAIACDALVERSRVDAAQIEDVIFGCVCQVGAQSSNIGRGVVLASRTLPESVPGTSVDRQCGSSQQAIHFAAQAVMSGTNDCVIAGGVEVMSMVPIGANVIDGFKAGHGQPSAPSMLEKYSENLKSLEQFGMKSNQFSQFGGAELLGKKFGVTREEADHFGAKSHARAVAAQKAGRFADEIVPTPVAQAPSKKANAPPPPAANEMHTADEGVRPSTTPEGLSKMKAMFPNGILTPGTSSQIADGAAAVLICNERGLQKLGLRPRARIISLGLAATDPVMMMEAPIPASQQALKKAGLKIDDIDLYEVNEAFATVPLAWQKAMGADLEKLNVNGGAMALGHPLGGTGAKLMTTLVHELERRGGRYGLLAICEGGGTANATVIERLPASKL